METYIENTSEITVVGLNKPSIAICDAAKARAEIALRDSQQVVLVGNAEEQKLAVDARTALKSLQKAVELSRELVKRPVLEIGRLIDGTAKEFLASIDAEVYRLNLLISKFQKAESDRHERLRIDQERIRQQALEEAYKKNQELEAKANAAKSAAAKLKVLQAQEAEEAKLAETIRESVKAENVSAPVRTAGMRIRKEWKFEVTDIKAVFAAKPDLVLLEPNNTMIRGMIVGGVRECPGLRIYEHIST